MRTEVIFHVHSRYVPEDTTLPNVRTERVLNTCRGDYSCSEQHWTARFLVQDPDSGLFRVAVKDSSDGTPFWWKDNHPVGGKDEVVVEAAVSCCSTGLSLEVEDVKGNFVVTYEDIGSLPEPRNWNLVIGISAGVGVLVLLVLVGVGVCVYRRKYTALPQG